MIPVEVSQLANAIAAADDSPFAQAFRAAWPEALAKALAEIGRASCRERV